ncbi:MAG: deoxyribose-phosphate aldolase [Bacteroidia bacterium]|nr:deoxyribose-phosphate aldolase [Bacteroidia bacterium]
MLLQKEFILAETARIAKESEKLSNIGNLKTVFSLIDLTTLNTTDNDAKVRDFCEKVNNFSENFSDFPNVAAICIYPSFVGLVRKTLKAKNVNIASVVGGFPSSQTFISIKLSETSIAVEKGADEVDMVISVGKFLEKDYQSVANEVTLIKAAAGKAHVKVILETGALSSFDEIYLASMLSMEAGADFIKTSTGKMEPAATPEAVLVMVTAIKDYFEKTGRMVGIKPAGGVVTPEQALVYFAIVKEVLGDKWLTPEWFRLGASRLANNLLSKIKEFETGDKKEINYF